MFKNIIYIRCFLLIASLSLLFYLSYLENNNIVISKYMIKKNNLPKEFNNFKILQISDLHSKVFSGNNDYLVSKILSQNPDIIVITGDLIDRRKYNEEPAIALIGKIKTIAPIYYVPGNHEGWSGKFSSLERKLKDMGVIVLRNEVSYYEKETERIAILGIDDPAFNTNGYSNKYKDSDIIRNEIDQINKGNSFKILLSHRPEHFDIYVDKNIDIAFTGHAHGGQIILPFIGGVLAPNQGFFPKYYKGIYSKNNTFMVVNRGLGNSIAPQRLFNKPELISIILTC